MRAGCVHGARQSSPSHCLTQPTGASPSPSPQRRNRGDRRPRRSLKLWESIRQSPCGLKSGRRECLLGRGLKVHGHSCCSRTFSNRPLAEIRILRIGSPAARIVTPRVELLEMGVWNGPHQDSNIEKRSQKCLFIQSRGPQCLTPLSARHQLHGLQIGCAIHGFS